MAGIGQHLEELDSEGLLSELSNAIRDTANVSSEYLILDNPDECARAIMDVMRSAKSGNKPGIIMGAGEPFIADNTIFDELPKKSNAMTADQQIRAKALELAVGMWLAEPSEKIGHLLLAEQKELLWRQCADFERYIREGK